MEYEIDIANKASTIWNNALLTADNFVSKNDLANLTATDIQPLAENQEATFLMEVFSLKRLAYDPKEGIIDKLVNVYSSLHNLESNVFFMIHGEISGQTEFYIGCRGKNIDASSSMLKRSFEGNFPGIELETNGAESKNAILDKLLPLEYQRKNVVSLSVSADFRRDKVEEMTGYSQGIEKFINTMRGQDYTAIILAEPINKSDINEKRAAYENIATELSKYSKLTVSYNESNSTSVSESLSESVSSTFTESISNSVSKNTSVSVGKTKGRSSGNNYNIFGISHNSGKNSSYTNSNTSGEGSSESHSTSNGQNIGNTKSNGKSTSDTKGTTVTLNIDNKRISSILAKIEYELKKLDNAESFGIWDTAVYLVSEDMNNAVIGANSIRSLVIGDESGKSECFLNCWGNSLAEYKNNGVADIINFLHHGMHPVFKKRILIDPTNASNKNNEYLFTPAVAVGGNVLPTLLGLPMKSVSGITVAEITEFGRNIVTDDYNKPGNREIRLGEVVYMGKKDSTEVKLYVNTIASHMFVCGTPGTGKSNAIYKMIYSLSNLKKTDGGYSNVKFLVVEPAKGEYKNEFGKMPGINIFTADPDLCRLLRINPFEFPYEKVKVADHIDQVKTIIGACWSLTAAMPAILSDAIEHAYRRVGWDLKNSIYVMPGEVKFPSFKDVLDVLPKIISRSSYSAQAKGDYTGALVTRVSSLTKGIVGTIFEADGTISDEILFDENTIIDLSTVGSADVKSLIMGVIVMKLKNYRKATAKQANYPLRHVTILEEAHNILPNCSTNLSEDSANVQGQSVKSISEAISEMRTYGEGFIIVDQTPSAVADVAISNTSTKIILRLPGEKDIQAAGSSIGLSDEQKKMLSKLPRGHAIVKQGDWIDPIMVLIDRAQKTFFTKRLDEFYYEDLMQFRGDLIEKCLMINMRNAKRDYILSADKKTIVDYINRQHDIAQHHIDYILCKWLDFCTLDAKSRHRRISFFIMDVLSFHEGLIICTPKIREAPKDIVNFDDDDEYKEKLYSWIEEMAEILKKSYVTCSSEQNLQKIIYHICCYCIEIPITAAHKICSTSVVKKFPS